jgi:WD domain, G-beta repeat
LTAKEIRMRFVPASDVDGWDRFPQTVREALARDLHGGYRPADLVRVRDLLLPLAYAEGLGLPRQLWPLLADALSEGWYTQSDVTWLLEDAGAYLVEALEDDHSVYRLSHKVLAECLRDGCDDLDLQQRITDALLARVPTPPGGTPDWLDPAVPAYIRTHLAAHAAAAGRLGRLMSEPGYLVAAEPGLLVAALADAERHEDWPDEVARACDVYRRASHLLGDMPSGERAAALELVARQVGDDRLADRLRALEAPQPWQTLWARWQLTNAHRIVGGHRGCVSAVALTQLGSRAAVVSGGYDGAVWVWDLITGKPVDNLLTGHPGGVLAVAAGVVDGRAVAVAGGSDGTAWAWDLTTGKPMGNLLTDHTDGVLAVAMAQLGSRAVVVSGGYDGAVQVWDLATGRPVGGPLEGHNDWVLALAVTQLGGRAVVVSGGAEGTVRVWDLAAGRLMGGPVESHSREVLALAVTQLDGRAVVVSGGGEGAVRIWDLATGGPVSQPLTGHRGTVGALALTQLGGRAAVVSGGYDGAVRVWDLATGRPLTKIELDASVHAIACRGPIVVAATDHGLVALRLTCLLATSGDPVPAR